MSGEERKRDEGNGGRSGKREENEGFRRRKED